MIILFNFVDIMDYLKNNIYYIVIFLYQLGMTLSTTAMPIYFKNENAVSVYGVAYSVMAISGAFSFVYGIWVDKIGFIKALWFGIFVYGIALLCRTITTPAIAIMIAIIAGIGASTAGIAIRNWTLYLSQNSNKNSTQLTASRSLLNNLAMFVGTGLVSLLAFYFANIYFDMLLLAGLMVLSAGGLVFCLLKDQQIALLKKEATKKSYKNLSKPAILIICITFLGGIHIGLLKPYLILMFIDFGLSESKSVFVFLLTTLTSMAMTSVLLKYNQYFKHYAYIGFLISELLLAVVFLLLAVVLAYYSSLWLLIILAILRSGLLSLSVCFDEVFQYEILDKDNIGLVIGFLGTAFLVGDAVGSLITSTFIIPNTPKDYAMICVLCAIMAFVNVGIVVYLKRCVAKIVKK